MQYMTFLLAALIFSGSAAAAPAASQPVSLLSRALHERMLLMKDVAAFKKVHNKPVEDLTREKDVLAEAQEKSAQAGLDPQSVTVFFQALMDASKAIQYRYMADWLAKPQAVPPAKDLAELRKQINQLDEQILQAIHQQLSQGSFTKSDLTSLHHQLDVQHLSGDDINNVLQGLEQIKLKR
ncbi:chorismate mutase [Pantoea stewartii subsp. indologenes]|uniref:chorismate mutase n=1 Tax=Pantoea stewartii TaxID=66269 RepID=UPI00197FA4D4|nr:chorismate mutase [Pantoea stewartii]MDK2633887.1 chorismate mutase [Pantoea stewartii subsp. indologenes]